MYENVEKSNCTQLFHCLLMGGDKVKTQTVTLNGMSTASFMSAMSAFCRPKSRFEEN